MGLLNSYREICKDREIIFREASVGVSLLATVLSKAITLFLVEAVQAGILTAGFVEIIHIPQNHLLLDTNVEIFITIFLLMAASSAMGLLVSASLKSSEAAVLLVLATHAAGKEVIVSRGELVEIGGSFRIPDVMEASGAKLVEVGATNRTHLSDYERAITPDTAMILKVHPSNYRIEGFHEEVGSRELAALAHKHGLLFYEDQGSGALLPDDILVRGGEETTPASVAAGLDIVSCSGDKLLGAAQAGIIMGRRDLVQACGSHPLMRALRPGKLALSALEATLRIYMDGADVAHRDIPVLSMLTLPQAHLERRARKLRELMVAGLDKAGCPCAVQVEIVEESSTPGGGSLPTVELPTMCVAVRLVDERLTVDALKRSLVQDFDTPVVTRASHDRVLFDVRTLVGDRDIETAASTLVACVKKAIAR